MCQRSKSTRTGSRLAEEVQLLAEEEFVVKALKLIRQQRNCLQIERFHLESLKQQLMNPIDSSVENEQSAAPGPSKKSANPAQTNPTELMSVVDMMSLGSKKLKEQDASMHDDVQCNNQELDLNLNPTISVPRTSKRKYNQYDYSSDDNSSSSDASNGDDIMIDINMLMNGSHD